MQTPDFGDAGWYDRGPRPGAPGPAVLVAHVHGPAGDDVFARLKELEPGDRVTVRRTDGRSTFVVESVEQAGKTALPYDRIWNDTDRPVLRLITCGGTPDPVTRMYPDNTIVYARLAPLTCGFAPRTNFSGKSFRKVARTRRGSHSYIRASNNPRHQHDSSTTNQEENMT